jgi:hypothetical protein
MSVFSRLSQQESVISRQREKIVQLEFEREAKTDKDLVVEALSSKCSRFVECIAFLSACASRDSLKRRQRLSSVCGLRTFK